MKFRISRMSVAVHVFLVCLLFSGAAAIGGDWLQFQGPNRDAISIESDWLAEWPEDGPPVLWTASLGTGFTSFAVAGPRTYTMGSVEGMETIYCLETETGKTVWKHAYKARLCDTYHEGGPTSTPLVDGDSVYTLGKEGHCNCLDAATGAVKWSRNLPVDYGVEVSDFGISVSPMVEGDKLIVDFGMLMGLDKKTGKEIWKNPPVPRAFTSPTAFTLDGRRCGATLNGYGLLVFDLNTGEEGCRYKWETFDRTNCTTPVVSGNRIFISSAYDVGGAVLEVAWGKEPKVLWNTRNMRNHYNICGLHEGYLYGFDGNVHRDNQGELRCISFETGELMWSEPSMLKGGLVIAGGKIIAITDKGELAVIEASPKGFKAISRFQALGGRCWTPPVLSNGLLFVRNAVGEAICFDLRLKKG